MTERVIVARLGAEWIALGVLNVVTVVDAPTVHPLPLMPAGVIGQLAIRDDWIPVLDARSLVGVGRDGSGPGAAVVLRGARGAFAIWVDDVEEVRAFSSAQERPVPALGDRAGLLRGLVWHEGRLIACVDTTALLAAVEDTLHARTIL